MSQYVGKLISLVDTRSVRYIGVLSSISAETSTLILKNVTVYGTESRVSGPEEVAKESAPRPEMEFKGSEVSDLQVLESDSASTSKQSKPAKSGNRQSKPQQKQTDQTTDNDNNDDNEDIFERTQRLVSSSQSDESVGAVAAYNKSSSFFDNLGSESSGRETSAQQRSLNMETFGESGFNRSRMSGRGRGGHRGRGGYRGRGGHRDSGAHDSNESRSYTRQTNDEPSERRNDSYRGNGRGRGRGGRGRGRGGRGNSSGGQGQQYTEFVPGGQFA